MACCDAVQHHVHRGRAASTGHQAGVALVEFGRDRNLWVTAAEFLGSLPMHGDRLAAQNPGLGQHKGTGIDCPDLATRAPQAADLPKQGRARVVKRIKSRADDEKVRQIRQGAIAAQLHPVGCLGKVTIRRMDRPGIKLPSRQPVGNAQRFERGEERDRRETGHKGESERLGHGRMRVSD